MKYQSQIQLWEEQIQESDRLTSSRKERKNYWRKKEKTLTKICKKLFKFEKLGLRKSGSTLAKQSKKFFGKRFTMRKTNTPKKKKRKKVKIRY